MTKKKRAERSDADLRALALKWVEGRVVTSQTVPHDLWRLVFIPLAFMTNPKRELRGVRMIYAILGEDKTTGQQVNGYPIFFSCRTMRAAELKRFVTLTDEARAAREAFLKS